jgi:hypothetical protein
MKITPKLVVALLLVVSVLSPSRAQMINTDVVRRSIVFLLYPRSDDPSKISVGTGFLLGIPSKADPKLSYKFIVTARHVIDPEWAGCPWKNPESLTVRVNTKDYQPGVSVTGVWQDNLSLVLNGHKTWAAHSDDRIDIAIIAVPLEMQNAFDKQDVNTIGSDSFGSSDEMKQVNIGANLISAGLVPGLWSQTRNYPAFKFAKVSYIPDEPLKMQCEGGPAKDRLAWLIAGTFVEGNSGSPIFLQPLEFNLGPPFKFTGPRPMGVGILSGLLPGADLGEMVPEQYLFEIVEKYMPDADTHRGSVTENPKP